MPLTVLVADDQKKICDLIAEYISELGYKTIRAYSGEDVSPFIGKPDVSIFLLDVNMPGADGIEIARQIQQSGVRAGIILMSGQKEIIDSINALELGVLDFLTKPIDYAKLKELLESAARSREETGKTPQQTLSLSARKVIYLKDANFDNDYSLHDQNIGKIGIYSAQMKNIFNKLLKLKEYPEIPALITGKTGTGKEIIARYLHYGGHGKNEPFIPINCSAISKELFEAELFGYEKGAYTGADPGGSEGKIKLAGKGTLFLDEITEIPITSQAKLLRILQEREYFRIGGKKNLPVQSRVVCATNRNIPLLIKKGFFRPDLYFRLNVCQIHLPPLKKRSEEIIPLTLSFMNEQNTRLGRKFKGIESRALKLLEDYSWPGNVRELQNVITKAMLFQEGRILTEKDFKWLLTRKSNGGGIPVIDTANFQLPQDPFNLDDFTKDIVRKALSRFNGNKTRTARFLGLSVIQMYRRYKV